MDDLPDYGEYGQPLTPAAQARQNRINSLYQVQAFSRDRQLTVEEIVAYAKRLDQYLDTGE